MKILALDVFKNKLSELVECLHLVFPEDDIISFTDPFFAAQYGLYHKVDMVFTEILMGGLGGLTVATMIRKNNKGAFVVFLADTDKYRDESKEVNYSVYLVRPITTDAIKEIISA